jgi:hypothetical protein
MNHICLLFDYFCDYFWEIFLKYFWNIFEKHFKKKILIQIFFHTILLRFMLNLTKNVILKKIEIHLQVLLLLKSKCYIV